MSLAAVTCHQLDAQPLFPWVLAACSACSARHHRPLSLPSDSSHQRHGTHGGEQQWIAVGTNNAKKPSSDSSLRWCSRFLTASWRETDWSCWSELLLCPVGLPGQRAGCLRFLKSPRHVPRWHSPKVSQRALEQSILFPWGITRIACVGLLTISFNQALR